MPLPSKRGIQGDDSKGTNRDRPGSHGACVQFIPMFFDGYTWAHISAPRSTARAACLNVTVCISLLSPSASLSDLDVTDERNRVRRKVQYPRYRDLIPLPGRTEDSRR